MRIAGKHLVILVPADIPASDDARPQFYQTRSAWSKDQGSNENHSPVHNFAPTVTKFCVMWEGQALPQDTKFGNCRDKIVDSRAFLSWSLILGLSWSGLIKLGPGHQQVLCWLHGYSWFLWLLIISTSFSKWTTCSPELLRHINHSHMVSRSRVADSNLASCNFTDNFLNEMPEYRDNFQRILFYGSLINGIVKLNSNQEILFVFSIPQTSKWRRFDVITTSFLRNVSVGKGQMNAF